MEFTIGAGRRDDIETYVELLVEAFADDPLVVEQAGPDAEAGLRAQFRALIDAVYLDTGKVDVAYVDGEIAGVALWLTPKDSQKTDGVGRRLIRNVKRVRTFSRHVPELLRALPPARQIPRLVSATRTMAGAVPRIPHWHLMDIAVSAEHRGHNMGGRLLEHGLDRVDQSQAPAYLEASTPRVAKLYRRHGFGTIQVLHVGNAPVHAMLRPVQDAS